MAEQPKYVTTADGRRITYTRWKYEETLRQQNNLANVEQVLTAQATTLANVGASMAQQEYGGYLRTIIPNLLDTYGNVNAQAAINYYDQARLEWSKAFGATASRQVTRSSVAAREKRFAAAKTQGAYRVGTMTAEEFAAKFLPTYKTLEKSEAVIGFAMKVRAKSGHEPSISAMNNALTREVASYHRDTVLFNSALDPYASRVQRVAQANACEFCKLMALGSTSGKVRVSTYAVKFHSKCHCTIQTLWEGEEPIRPDYYDQFEEEYVNAAGQGRSAKETLEQWRQNTKAAAPNAATPSLGKMFEMQTDDELLAAFKDVFAKQKFAGFTVDPTSATIQTTGYISVKGKIKGPAGYGVGAVERSFIKSKNGIEVQHYLLDLYADAKGKGFGTAFSKWSEDWYKQNDVKRIKLTAGLQDGAYTWAKAGYVWDAKPNLVYKRLANIVDGEIPIPGLDELAAKELKIRLNKLSYRMGTLDFTDPDYPQPFEIANMEGPEINGKSFGRWLLKETQWSGRKDL